MSRGIQSTKQFTAIFIMIINSLKNSMHWAKILTFAFALSFLMFFFPTTAMANSCQAAPGTVFKELPVNRGSFRYAVTKPVEKELAIRSVIVCLDPPIATGKIESIIIDGPSGREFGCFPTRVRQGTNLISACGGPAILRRGETTYRASGSGFTPEQVKLTVSLSTDFE